MNNIYEEIIKKFGEEKQIIVAIEELSELQKALCKYLRNGELTYNLLEEMADVYIMLEQLKIIFNIDLPEIFDEMNRKLERTKERYLTDEKK